MPMTNDQDIELVDQPPVQYPEKVAAADINQVSPTNANGEKIEKE